jgi:hypothetical protein
MDNGRFSWYHALHDTVATPRGMKNIFELVDCAHWIQALSVRPNCAMKSFPYVSFLSLTNPFSSPFHKDSGEHVWYKKAN